MRLPAGLREPMEAALAAVGGAPIVAAETVSGGCISETARLRTATGQSYFAKWNQGEVPAGLFHAEARGLAALEAAGAVRVPYVIAVAAEWLLLEWLESGPAAVDTWAELGRSMAALHRTRETAFGADADNYIGPLPQSNRRHRQWAEFWRAERLLPQLALAGRAFDSAQRARLERFVERDLDGLLAAADTDGASLLHGDLWSGNVHVCRDARAAVLDPSSYYGHREVDLAMAALFGGFSERFFDAYAEAWPLSPGHEQRRAAYQLYYLMVHVNLFGSGYVDRTLQALVRAGG